MTLALQTRKPSLQRGGAKTTLLVLALLLALVTALAMVLWRDYQRFSSSVVFSSAKQSQHTLEFPEGSGLDQLIAGLRAIDADAKVGQRWQWQVLLRELGLEKKLKAGEYVFSNADTPRSILFALAEGKVVQHRITIIEGTRFADLRALIVQQSALRQSIGAMSDADVLRAIGAEETHPEGLFLADTYRFPKGYSDIELLKTAYWAQKKLLRDAWEKRQPDLPYSTPYEALIMASIIEKETAKASERPEIAGVFVRRLRMNMRLQTDPTVIYGMGESYDGNIRRKDLTTDTPYNTYTRAGLPPTPIALPGRAAITAALNPNDGKTLYFVAKGDGSHQFSETLDAHNAAVREYQLR
jgi:UPF0755 protein